MELYQGKQNHYFSNIRFDLIALLPSQGINRLLELGAGGGDTLVEIKNKKLANEVVGIELMKLSDSNQENSAIDKFIYGDFEEIYDQLQQGSFDAIICGDVLEHLVDPWKVVEKLTSMLSPGGIIIISTPNARYYEMFLKVFVKGSFEYTDHGLFDKTHLRFFCKKNLKKMVTDNGLVIQSIMPSFVFHKKSKYFLLNKLSLGIFEEFLAMQYIVCANVK